MNPRCTILTATLSIAAAAAVCAALAGCSTHADANPAPSTTSTGTATSGGTSATPSSTSTTLDAAAQEAKDRQDAEAVWSKVDALRGTVQSMPADQVTPALAAVAVDPALSRLQEQNAQSRAEGQVGYGTDIHYISWPKPIKGADTAVLDDCSDGSQSGLMDAKTGNKLTVGTPNTPVQVTLKRTDQGWKVASAELVAGVTCTPGKAW